MPCANPHGEAHHSLNKGEHGKGEQEDPVKDLLL